jgi:hypothetical protein
MYDSVSFHLEENQFELRNEQFFDGKNTKQISGRYDTDSLFVSGVRAYMKKNKKYYPSINLTNRSIGNYRTGRHTVKRLEIQTSFQKTRYETSKYELSPDDFPFVIDRTIEYLKMAGVSTDVKNLKKGVLSSIAFSKSIQLPFFIGTAEQVIKKVAPINYKPRSKFRFRDYDDGWEGLYIKFHNPIRGFGAYCKYGEILNNGYTLVEEEIKRQVLEGKQPRDIIRFELTLEKKPSLEAVLRRFMPTKKKDFTLEDIFANYDISQKLLLEEFDEVYSPINTGILSLAEMEENRLRYILDSKISDLKDRALMAYLVNIAINFGENHLWKQLKREVGSNITYERTKRKVEKIIKELGISSEPACSLAEFLRSEIVKFEPIKPSIAKKNCQLQFKNI